MPERFDKIDQLRHLLRTINRRLNHYFNPESVAHEKNLFKFSPNQIFMRSIR